jgi:hypothetical protein
MKWDDAATPWRIIDSTVQCIYLAEDRQSCQPVEQEMQQMTDIPDAKQHEKANLDEIATDADHLTNSEQKSLVKLSKSGLHHHNAMRVTVMMTSRNQKGQQPEKGPSLAGSAGDGP